MKKLLLVILTLTVTVCFLSIEVSANFLSECNICGTTGKCDKCSGEKMYVCDRCGGSGKGPCDQCDDGYVTCHICNAQKKIPCCNNPDCQYCHGTGSCDCRQCGGTGFEQCNGCKGTQMCNCTGCGGTGQNVCDRCNGDGICRNCLGTGYLSGNNNGVNNIPRKGDTVELAVTGGGRTITWGGSGGVTAVTSSTKSVNSQKDSGGNVPQTQSSPLQENLAGTEGRDYSVPENRSEINIGENNQTATAFFRTQEMTDSEKATLNSMPEEELKQVLRDVDSIISSARVGELSGKSEEVLTKLLEKNKIQDPASVKLCRLNFEGHITLEFPVMVSVSIDSTYFAEEDKILAYHIADDGTVESLGEARGYAENGKVSRIEFMTKGFSDFFVTTQKLDTEENLQVSADSTEGNNFWVYVVLGVALVLLVVITVVRLERRKREKNT